MSVLAAVTLGQWELLQRHPAPAAELKAMPTAICVEAGAVMIAVDSARRRHLLVPVSRLEDVVQDGRSQGCRVAARSLVGHGAGHFADLVCVSKDGFDVFGLLINDILARIQNGSASPGSVCAQALEHWRELLGSGGRSGVGPSQVIGLFGELWVLRRLAKIAPAAIASWLGPLGTPHDFSFGATALEVKTTSSATGNACQIHGATQLEAPPHGILHLAFLRVEQRPGTGQTLADLIAELHTIGVAPEPLLERLDAVDYPEMQKDLHVTRQWSAVEFRVWRVADSFPRIVPGSFSGGILPPGVVGLNYVIDLAAAGPPLTEAEVEEMFQALSGKETS
jgi:hypothetical protein